MWYIGVARKMRENNKSGCHAQLWQPHRKETKMVQKNSMAASLQVKKGRLYAVIQQKCPDGKFKSVWRALGLADDAPKSKVNKVFREVVANYETEAAEEIERASRPQNEIPVFEYMSVWLEKAAKDLQINTYNSYHSMIYGLLIGHSVRRWRENLQVVDNYKRLPACNANVFFYVGADVFYCQIPDGLYDMDVTPE